MFLPSCQHVVVPLTSFFSNNSFFLLSYFLNLLSFSLIFFLILLSLGYSVTQLFSSLIIQPIIIFHLVTFAISYFIFHFFFYQPCQPIFSYFIQLSIIFPTAMALQSSILLLATVLLHAVLLFASTSTSIQPHVHHLPRSVIETRFLLAHPPPPSSTQLSQSLSVFSYLSSPC